MKDSVVSFFCFANFYHAYALHFLQFNNLGSEPEISAMGMVPRIKPKSNTVRNAKGSQPWRGMVDLYMDYRETFDSEYHQRSVIESVFAALKKMYGDCTRCRRSDNRTREISIRATCAMFLFDPDCGKFGVESGRYGAPLARRDDMEVPDLVTFAKGVVGYFLVPDPPGDPEGRHAAKDAARFHDVMSMFKSNGLDVERIARKVRSNGVSVTCACCGHTDQSRGAAQ